MESKKPFTREEAIIALAGRVSFACPYIEDKDIYEILSIESNKQLFEYLESSTFALDFINENWGMEEREEAFIRKHGEFMVEFPYMIKKHQGGFILNKRKITLTEVYQLIKERTAGTDIKPLDVFNHMIR